MTGSAAGIDGGVGPQTAARRTRMSCTLIEFLRDTYGDTGGGWLSTHPYTSERIIQLEGHPMPPECAPEAIRNAQVEAARQEAIELRKRLEEAERRTQEAGHDFGAQHR